MDSFFHIIPIIPVGKSACVMMRFSLMYISRVFLTSEYMGMGLYFFEKFFFCCDFQIFLFLFYAREYVTNRIRSRSHVEAVVDKTYEKIGQNTDRKCYHRESQENKEGII